MTDLLVRSGLEVAFCCLALPSPLLAQVRQPLVGTVLDRAGQPVMGAVVTLIEDDAELVGIDPVDVVAVKSGEHGRFRAAVLRGVRYSGFAVGPEVDGRADVGTAVTELAAGRIAEIRMRSNGRRRRVALTGFAAWGTPQELRARLLSDRWPGFAVDLPSDAEHSVDVPPIAVLTGLCLCDRSGAMLCRVGVPPDGELLAPQPATLVVRVVDAVQQPIAGAQVAVYMPRRLGRSRPAATTDAAGRAIVKVDSWRSPFDEPMDMAVMASMPGFAEGASGWWERQPMVDWRVVSGHEGRELRITLQRAESRKGRIAGAAGRKAGIDLIGLVSARQQGMQVSYFLPRRYDVDIGDDGTFALPPLPPSCSDVRLVLPSQDGMRTVLLPSRTQELDIDLADCEPLSVQLLDAERGPATAAMVMLLPFAPQGLDLEHAVHLLPDQAGKFDVRLQRGSWVLVATSAGAFVARELEAWERGQPMSIAMQPKLAMAVRVVDAAGKPIAGASFAPGQFTLRPSPRAGSDAALAALGWNQLSADLSGARTDKDGQAVLLFLPWPGVQPNVHAYVDDLQHRSRDIALVAGSDPVTLRIDR